MNSYDKAIQYLARREHSAKELVDKLTAKGFDHSDIHETLARLQQHNLQSDERFVECLTRTRIAQGKGPRRIIQELQEHHIPLHHIKISLEQANVCWFTLASNARIQRFGENVPTSFPEKAKQMRFLQYRGFEMEQIQRALSRHP